MKDWPSEKDLEISNAKDAVIEAARRVFYEFSGTEDGEYPAIANLEKSIAALDALKEKE